MLPEIRGVPCVYDDIIQPTRKGATLILLYVGLLNTYTTSESFLINSKVVIL